MSAPCIDAHQHYWRPERGDYGWMPKDDPVLARAYGPGDLAPLLRAHAIAATVLVQAAPTLAETEYLLGIADATDSVAGVVGWIDFGDSAALRDLERLARHPKFLGVRPMIQDIPDPDWMLRPAHDRAFRALSELGLTFDALGHPRHLGNFLTLFTRHPDLRAVIDHAMKPRIADHPEGFGAWAEGMTRLARETGAFCKLSGLATEAGADWRPADLRPCAAHVLDAFGPARVMWGSDWPVCLLRASYGRWLATARTLTADLAPGDRAEVFGGAAARFYGLGGLACA